MSSKDIEQEVIRNLATVEIPAYLTISICIGFCAGFIFGAGYGFIAVAIMVLLGFIFCFMGAKKAIRKPETGGDE